MKKREMLALIFTVIILTFVSSTVTNSLSSANQRAQDVKVAKEEVVIVKEVVVNEKTKKEKIKQYLKLLENNVDDKTLGLIANSIYYAHHITGIDDKLISVLMWTESKFDVDALSPTKKYKGLMQIPRRESTIYPEVDIIHGSMKLKTRLNACNGNTRKALAQYKGGNKPGSVAYRQADYVLTIYKKLKNSTT